MHTTQKMQFNKKINIDFSGGEVTGNAWMLLFHEFSEKMNLWALLERYLPEKREWQYLHTKPEIIEQIIMRIVSGISSNNNYVYQKVDPVFMEIHEQKIASSATCSRLENTFNLSDVEALKKVQRELESYNLRITNPNEIIIDLDTTYDPASENIEYARFNGHYGKNGYSPLLAFNGLSGDFLKGNLRPGNYHCSTFADSFLKDLIQFYQEKWIQKIIMRGDSAFSSPKLYEPMETKQVEYFIKLKSNASLQKMVEGKWVRWLSLFVDLKYQAKSWDTERRVVACIDWVQNKKQQEFLPVYSFVITNNTTLSSEEVFSMYNGRATMEKSIEEAKNGFDIDHLSHKQFKTNAVKFQIHLLAIQLVQLFRKFSLMREWAGHSKYLEEENSKRKDSTKITRKFKKKKIGRKQIRLPDISSIRRQVFSIPARIVRTGRQIYCKCASSFVFQDLFRRVLCSIQNLEALIL